MPTIDDMKIIASVIGWPAAFLAMAGYGQFKGVWRWGHEYETVCQQRDFWQKTALDLLGRSEVQSHLLEKTRKRVIK